jgi:microcystin-dependent protein
MSEPFIAEIRIWAGNFAPRGWAFCNGQLLPIAQNTALFSLVGTIYGGDGRTTLGLPDLQGRAPMHPGRGPGLTARQLGQKSGPTTVTLTEAQLASHNHRAQVVPSQPTTNTPGPSVAAAQGQGRGANIYSDSTANVGELRQLADVGAGGAHENLQPYLALSFIIALQGVYPSRS